MLCGIILLTRKQPLHKADNNPATISFSKNTVAVIQIYGPIYISQSPSGLFRGADSVVRRLHKLNSRDDVKAVVLRINSPGGSVAAVQEICDEVNLLRKNKKIVVTSMGDVTASGGYYIASQSDRIIADKGTLTGSIGVIIQLANVQELFRKVGVRMETIRTGPFKDIGSPFRELTPQERQLFQGLIDDSYNQFVDAVAQGRKMDRAKVLKLADGRVFTGIQAKDAGLIDDFGNSEEAIRVAAGMAGIKGTPTVIGDTGYFDRFLQIFNNSTSDVKIVSDLLANRKIRLDYMLE